MARLPLYEQQTLPQGGRADASMMGGASAQAMAQAGDVLAQIGERMQRREDAIASTHTAREQDRWLTESRRATETEDLVKKQTFDDWRSAAEAHKQQLLNNYTGSPRGRGALEQQLTNQLYQHEKALREQQHKAQIGMLTEFIEDEKNNLAIQVGLAPEMLGTAFESFDDRVDQYEGVLPTELLESYKKSARGALVQTAVSQLEAQGRFDEARSVLNDGNFGKFLPPDVSRRLTIGVAAGQAKQDIESRQREANVQSWAMAMGVDPEDMTPQQRMLAENASTQTMNYVEKINLATILNNGQPLSPEVRDRILKTDRAVTRTRISEIMGRMPAFESGSMSPQEVDEFRADVFKEFPRQFRLNPVTERQEPIPGTGGFDDLQAALGRPVVMPGTRPTPKPIVPGGVPYGAQGVEEEPDYSFVDSRGRTDYGVPPESESQIQPVDQPQAQPFATPLPESGPVDLSAWGDQAGDVAISDSEVATVRKYGGLYMMADMLRGPRGGVGRFGANFPGVALAPQDFQRAKTEAELMQRKMVNALRTNPRYAEGERRDLAQSIDITASFLGNSDAYRTDLETIDSYMAEEIQYWQSILNAPDSTGSDRRSALQFIPLMQQYRERINVPAQPQNRQEFDALPPGTIYKNLRGEIRRK